MNAPLLSAQGISFSHPGRPLFTRWSADFAPGLTWLHGPNGCGKSTLLSLLAGALPPFEGRLVAAGADATADPVGYRRQVFWCGPGAIAFDHLRSNEFFGFMASLYPRFDAAAAAAGVQGFGLERYLGQRLDALSTGTQRKVWITAALAAGAPVVLLDEPLNALDAASHAWLDDALAARAALAQQALVVASHESLGRAGECARVIRL